VRQVFEATISAARPLGDLARLHLDFDPGYLRCFQFPFLCLEGGANQPSWGGSTAVPTPET